MRGKSRFSLLKNRDFRLNANPLIESSLTSAIADGVNGAISGCWWREWRCQWTLIALSANADGAIGAVSGRWWRCQQTLMAWMALSADADGVIGAVSRCWWRCLQTLMALSADADGVNGTVSRRWWRKMCTSSAPSAVTVTKTALGRCIWCTLLYFLLLFWQCHFFKNNPFLAESWRA